MKKRISLLLVFCMVFALAACGEKKTEPEIKEWTRQGYFMDENENMLSVTWMDDVDEPGWLWAPCWARTGLKTPGVACFHRKEIPCTGIFRLPAAGAI